MFVVRIGRELIALTMLPRLWMHEDKGQGHRSRNVWAWVLCSEPASVIIIIIITNILI